MKKHIILNDINLNFGKTIIFKNLNFKIFSKEIIVIIGRAGCGATSLLKIISGLLFPQTGEVLIDGENLLKFTKKQILEYHKTCGFVFQNSALISNMTIFDNLALFFYYHKNYTQKKVKDLVEKISEKFHLSEKLNKRPNELSISERRLATIARALIHDPDLIFFDEPSANLDEIVTENIKNVMLELKEQEKTIILSTHNLNFALSFADKLAILNENKIKEIINFKEKKITIPELLSKL